MYLGGQNVTQTACTGQRKSKKSFKGVENFLRKVALNLGNSPSQTEVKIISCIPIDVTDLQDRILLLEKELEAAKSQFPPHNTKEISLAARTPVAHAAIQNQYYPNRDFSSELDEGKPTEIQKESTIGYVSSKQRSYAMTNTENTEDYADFKKSTFFGKKRKQLKKKFNGYQKPHFIYHAQTGGGPFIDKRDNASKIPKSGSNSPRRSKQFESKTEETCSDACNFSSPVLQDGCNRHQYCGNDSDLCSCCRGKFQNIDDHMTKPYCTLLDPLLTIATEDYVNNRGNYYDSTFYDLVPVKEKTVKCKKEDNGNTRNDFQDLVDMLCYPQDKSITRQRQYIVNYQTANPTRFASRKLSDRKVFQKHRPTQNYLDKQISSNSSKCCYVQCGNVYTKKSSRPYKCSPTNSWLHKNVNCSTSRSMLLTRNKNNECQTIVENPTATEELQAPRERENKTQETLNQIKNILQTVLIEVKTNAESKNAAKLLSTKDAVVQKGSSQNNVLERSTLLNSFSYSPYNSNQNATFLAQVPTNYYYPPNLQCPKVKCQHYPVFVQGTGKHLCNSYYKPPQNMNQNNVNTETSNNRIIKETRSRETDKLIKEIYKSLALSIDNPVTQTDVANNKDIPQTVNKGNDITRDIFIIPKAREVKTEPTKNRSYVTNMTSVDVRSVTKETITNGSEPSDTSSFRANKDRVRFQKFNELAASRSSDRSTSTELASNVGPRGVTKLDRDDSSESSSDSEQSVVTTTHTTRTSTNQSVKTKETGIFRRVFRMFRGKKSKISTSLSKTEESESETDSDYQTIYKEPVVSKPNPTIHFSCPPKHARKSRNHSKIFASRSRILQQVRREMQKRPLRDHDRMHWNRNNKVKDKYYNYPKLGSKPIYHQTFDARSAICDFDCQRRHREGQRKDNDADPSKPMKMKTGFKWLRKRKQGLCKCGDDWKKFLSEN